MLSPATPLNQMLMGPADLSDCPATGCITSTLNSYRVGSVVFSYCRSAVERRGDPCVWSGLAKGLQPLDEGHGLGMQQELLSTASHGSSHVALPQLSCTAFKLLTMQ